ncbi:hypothetical protein Tco_1403905 [Tanacetum coccineum]
MMAMNSSFSCSAFALIRRFTFSYGCSPYTLSILLCGSGIQTTLSWQTILALCLDNQCIPMITSKLLCPNGIRVRMMEMVNHCGDGLVIEQDIWVEEEENMKKMVMMKKIDDLNNEKDEKKWHSMVLEMKIEEIMCSKREIPAIV